MLRQFAIDFSEVFDVKSKCGAMGKQIDVGLSLGQSGNLLMKEGLFIE